MQEMKPIEEFPNYSITRDGKVWSHKRKRFLKGSPDRDGYRKVQLKGSTLANGRRDKNCLIHRLVALTYIPNPNNHPVVDHTNRKRLDNRVENLRWATVKENTNNKPIGRGMVRFSDNPRIKSKWMCRWSVCNKHHNKYFMTKEEADAYKMIVYQLRVLIRKMRGLSY